MGPRADLTADKVYTVSDAAVEVLGSIPEDKPVRVKLYFSPKDEMPTAMATVERDILEKLEEYRRRAKDRLVVEVVHLHADDAILRAIQEARAATLGEEKEDEKKEGERGAIEEKLLKEGVAPFRVRTGGITGSETKVVYAALSLTYGASKKEIIPQLSPGFIGALEQELITRVHRLVKDTKPVVALMAPIQSVDIPPQQMQLMQQLGIPLDQLAREQDDYRYARAILAQADQYEVQRLRPDSNEPLPPELKTLVLIRPEGLSERMQWEIARLLERGGSVVLAVQTFDTTLRPTRGGAALAVQRVDAGVEKLLARYGVSVPQEMVMNDKSFPLSFAMGPLGMGGTVTVDFPWIFRLDAANFDRETSLTNGVGGDFMLVEAAAPVKVDEAKAKELGLEVKRVLATGQQAWTREAPEFNVPADLTEKKPGQGPISIATLIRGQFPAAESTPPAWPSAGEETPPDEPTGPVTPAPGNLLVIGTARPFVDEAIVDQGQGGIAWAGVLMKNAVDALSLGDVLLRLAQREPTPRPIKDVDRGTVLFYQFLIVGLAPLLYLAIGITRLVMRRRRQERGVAESASRALPAAGGAA
jgi:ABC-type uncharacterized transport system involved in gliding motility auxiliary subunit